MKLPKELYDLGKMKLVYYMQLAIAVIFIILAFSFLGLSIYSTKSYFTETMICVAIANIVGFQASQIQTSYFLFQKLQEIQGQINKAKDS